MSRLAFLPLTCLFLIPLAGTTLCTASDQTTADPFATNADAGKSNTQGESSKPKATARNRAVVRAAANPFGGSDDPFGGGGDPFSGGDDGGNDGPFANGPFANGQEDPFGGDPFGGGNDRQSRATDDPFAANPNRPARRSVRSASAVTSPVKSARHPNENAAQYIRRRLGEPSHLTLVEIPLSDFAQTIGETFDIPVVINIRALEEIGLSTDLPVNSNLSGVALRSLLHLVLEGVDLTYAVRDEVLEITTAEAAEQNCVLETYSFPASIASKSDQVLDILQRSVVPQCWEQVGGPCSVSVIDNVLVVSATEPVHEGVVEFLKKIDDAYQRYKGAQKGGH